MEYDTIEDVTINVDEVNECYSRGYEIEGKQYLEKIEKQIIGNYLINEENEKKIIKAFDGLARKLSKGKVEILNELEKYGLNSDIITKLSLIGVETAPKLSSLINKPTNFTRNTTEDRYADEGFEDYENDFEDYDDVDKRAQTTSAAVVLPKYTHEEPQKLRSKTAPTNSQSSIPNLTPKYTGSSSTRSTSKLKTMGWINKGQWRLGEKIGSGSFGDVFQGMSDDGYLFAVKQLKIVDDKEIVNLISEIELMQSLDHPNIVKYLGTKVDIEKGVVYIFQEWVPGGSVAHLLKRFGPFSIGVIRTYTKQILEGLSYLHEHGIVHRDIKGGNILVDDSGVVKLADFGASTTMAFGETVETTTIKGTPYFMAPEVLSESKYGRRGDVWAVGCTIIQMLTGEPPWKDKKLQSLVQLHLLLSSWQGIPPIDREIPDDLISFLELCFEKDPKNRPMPKDLLLHEFLNPDDDLNDSLGGTNSNLREQLERAAARASFNPGDTFGDIDAILAQKASNKAPVSSSNQRERSSSTSSSHSDHGDTPPSNIISPVHQSSNNPFSRKSTAGLSPSPSAPQLHVPPSQPSIPPHSKTVIRSSGLTISPAIEQLTISPPSTSSSSGLSSRRGSADPVNIPSHISSPSSKSNASTPRIHEQPLNERKSSKNDDREHRRKGSYGSEDGIVPSNKQVHSRRYQYHQHDETDITPRSHHSNQHNNHNNSHNNNNNNNNNNQQNPPLTSSLPPSKFLFDNKIDSSNKKPTDSWQCESSKCRQFNSNDIDYCDYCALKRGATGERGNGARLFAG